MLIYYSIEILDLTKYAVLRAPTVFTGVLVSP